MKLLAPEAVGPLSRCSTKVQIRGNIAGANVIVVVNGVKAATHVSKAADGVYAIGATLNANDVVTARQSMGSDTSGDSLPITVQDAPVQMSAVTLQSKLYGCARRLWATGGAPGAVLQGKIGNQVVGSAEVVSGVAAFTYDPTLQVGAGMSLKQTSCNNSTQSQTTPKAVAQPSPLPTPVIEGPLIECQTTLTVSKVLDGAFVEFYRNGVLEKTWTFAGSREWRAIAELKKNDVIEVRQGFKCKKESPALEAASSKASLTVQGVAALWAPQFVGVPCPGTTYLTLSQLIPGARVVIALDGTEIGQTDAANNSFTFNVTPLPAGGKLTAHMRLCKKDGPDGKRTVSTGTTAPQDVKVSDLFACAGHVFVKVFGSSGNYLVFISNKAGQQISAYHNLVGFERLIPVSPSLVAGEEISVNVQGCGGGWQKFGPFAVVSASAPPPPEVIEPVEAGSKYVNLNCAHAGALIDLFVNNQWRGSTIALGNLALSTVAFTKALKTGESVFATLTLCGKTGEPSKSIKVKKARPARPVLIDPVDNATGVAVQPLFKWQDPSAGLENAATSYHLVARRDNGGGNLIDATSNSTQLACPVVLEHETNYLWKVESINSTASSGFANWFAFRTVKAPAPQVADLHLDPPISSSSPGFPRNTPIELHIGVSNDGNAPSDDFQVVFSMSYQNGGGLIDVVDATFPSLDGGQSTTIVSVPVTLPAVDVVIDVYLNVNGTEIDHAFRII
ncbi:hypothetical protein [Ideonella sp. A 288]|uniref:hypothetical protein n=1 Tax=Ideonella sp. A 288 TaxID=1962181 RepID=UPI000B4AAED4|nr:hypothetical protein [Ideonella sp. A 288]